MTSTALYLLIFSLSLFIGGTNVSHLQFKTIYIYGCLWYSDLNNWALLEHLIWVQMNGHGAVGMQQFCPLPMPHPCDLRTFYYSRFKLIPRSR